MTASITQFHCRAEVKTAPKGRVTPKILSKLHGLCSVRKHTLKLLGFRTFRDPETEFCKEPWPGAFCEMQFWPEGDKAPSKANFQALEGALEILFYFQPWNVPRKAFLRPFQKFLERFFCSIRNFVLFSGWQAPVSSWPAISKLANIFSPIYRLTGSHLPVYTLLQGKKAFLGVFATFFQAKCLFYRPFLLHL